ncbi:MAG: hypothetical protein LBR10_06515 [Prevotellaceae bacterium]|jgi:uncharacterized coiled-coil DUF342 family protein|nr:hypothetical protein [Prevotellaceae bacterium]
MKSRYWLLVFLFVKISLLAGALGVSDSHIEDEITDIQKKMFVFKQKMIDFENKMTELQMELDASPKTADFENGMNEPQTILDAISTKTADFEDELDALKREMDEFTQKIEGIDGFKNKSSKVKPSIFKNLITNLKKKSTESQNKTTNLKYKLTELRDETTKFKEKLTELKDKSTNLKRKLTELQNETNNFTTKLSEVDTKLFQTSIADFKRKSSELKHIMFDFENKITELKMHILIFDSEKRIIFIIAIVTAVIFLLFVICIFLVFHNLRKDIPNKDISNIKSDIAVDSHRSLNKKSEGRYESRIDTKPRGEQNNFGSGNQQSESSNKWMDSGAYAPQSKKSFSELYLSEKERERRLADNPNEEYLDLTEESAQKLFENRDVALKFEKKGGRYSASYILVDEKLLYLNFYKYNNQSSQKIKVTESIRKAYDITSGISSGFIKTCNPAHMEFDGTRYTIRKKGELSIVSNV